MVGRVSVGVISAVLCAAFLAAFASPARAADFIVSNTNGSGAGSLRAAVEAANANSEPDDIVFAEGVAGVISLGGSQIVISSDLTITGPGAEELTVSGGNASRIFRIEEGKTVGISGLTMTAGNGSGDVGGAIHNSGALTVEDSTFSNNSGGSGGAIRTGDLSSTDSSRIGSLTVRNSTFTQNSTESPGLGGAIQNLNDLTVEDSTFSKNFAPSGGGAISQFEGSLKVENSRFTENTTNQTDTNVSGGAISQGGNSTANIRNSVFSKNVAATGAGVGIQNGSATIESSTFEENEAVAGGAVFSLTNTTIKDSTLSANAASFGGGGAFTNGGNLTIESSTLSENTASGSFGGGGVYSSPDGATTIRNSTLSGNSSTSRGGGIQNHVGRTVIENSTITNNTAPENRGSGVSSVQSNGATVEFHSSIVADNTNSDADSGGRFVSNGHNLIGSGNSTEVFTATGDQTNVSDPGLVIGENGKPLLADNGGPTLTHALTPDSPALDRGSPNCPPPGFDQRGVERPQDGDGTGEAVCDIGSFEVDKDTTPPETTITAGPEEGSTTSDPTFKFASNEENSTFECRVNSTDEADFTECASPFAASEFSEGSNTFEVRATDAAGNVDETPAKRTFTVDTTAPETTITAGPEDGSATSDTTPTFEFALNEENSTFECRVGNGEFVPCTSPFTASELSEGSHTFEVRATDAVGNTDETPASRTFTVDATAPETTITKGLENGSTSGPAPTFEFTSNEEGSTFECRVDGGEFASCTSPFTTERLSEGSHTFEVRATDAVGNVDETPAKRTFTVDVTAPETTITAGPEEGATLTTRSATFEFASDKPNSTFECRVDGGEFAACGSPLTLEDLADGRHTFEVRATDAVGNTDETPASRTFAVAATPAPAPPAPQTATCAGRTATIVGTPGGGPIVGTPGPDVIVGTPGRDVIRGLGGNDLICGLGGNDIIYGGAGNDVIFGGAGNDVIHGGPGNDRLIGGPGKDILRGGPGNDVLNARDGVRGNDVVNGGPGRDRCFSDVRDVRRGCP